jgi:hypothetical protein
MDSSFTAGAPRQHENGILEIANLNCETLVAALRCREASEQGFLFVQRWRLNAQFFSRLYRFLQPPAVSQQHLSARCSAAYKNRRMPQTISHLLGSFALECHTLSSGSPGLCS